MNAANAKRLAWVLTVLALSLITLATVFRSTIDGALEVRWTMLTWAIMLVFTITGHLIASRRPGNLIGWLFLGAGVSVSVSALAGTYADYWTDTGAGSEALGQAAAVYGEQSWMPFILVPATFLLLLFPDGHLLSRRWLPVAWCASFGIAGGFVAGWFKPGPLEDQPELTNPYGVETWLLDVLTPLTYSALFVGVLGSAVSLFVRFRRARGEQRQQMKWIALAGAVAALTIPVMFAVYELVGQPVADAAIMLSVLALPAATAVAILRYRLYDIDVVINRTLVYGTLTATLATVYVGSVLLLQLVLSGLTQGSGLAVAASTLAVAALFRPVRGRIQKVVDRRFFRNRYDAERTLESFGARLRDEVDLATLSVDLQAVVAETMRPAHVSLWLRSRDPA